MSARPVAQKEATAPDAHGIPVTHQGVSRPTEELIIGVVGAVGSGVSKTAEVLDDILSKDYGYEVEIIKASVIINENAGKIGAKKPADNGSKRIKDLQKLGTALRKEFDECSYIAAKAIEKIAVRRIQDGYESTEPALPKSRRKVTIIDSLKHPQETDLLRRVYGNVYWQVTVFAPENLRVKRLGSGAISMSEIHAIFQIDENDENSKYGQKVRDTAYRSDFFIRNDKENLLRLKEVLERYMEILFNISVHTPTFAEAGMHVAVSAATKSACLSRQVGAAIYSSTGELISIGWNDVPKANGGLYSSDDGADDHRCYLWKEKVCHKDMKKEDLYKDIFHALESGNLLASGADKKQLRDALQKTPVKDLLEYSRSIHAEMEAIVSAARDGKSGLVGGTLYTTTFPCHNCARHIVAAGIKEVFYIEPYAKSLALQLHSDSIGVSDESGKVAFLQYEGVGPGSILKLFHNSIEHHGLERKNEDSGVQFKDKKQACPTHYFPLDSFATHEKHVVKFIESKESDKSSTGTGDSS